VKSEIRINHNGAKTQSRWGAKALSSLDPADDPVRSTFWSNVCTHSWSSLVNEINLEDDTNSNYLLSERIPCSTGVRLLTGLVSSTAISLIFTAFFGSILAFILLLGALVNGRDLLTAVWFILTRLYPFVLVFFSVIGIPLGLLLQMKVRRPHLIAAQEGRLVVWIDRLRVAIPMADCLYWKAYWWSPSAISVNVSRGPYWIVVCMRPPSSLGEPISFPCGLNGEMYARWGRILEEGPTGPPPKRAVVTTWIGFINGFGLGGLVGAVAYQLASALGAPKFIAVGSGVIPFVDCWFSMTLFAYAKHCDIRIAKTWRDSDSASLAMGPLIFAGVAGRMAGGLGLPTVLTVAILNAAIGFGFAWKLRKILNERLDASAEGESLSIDDRVPNDDQGGTASDHESDPSSP
jgi:hypothetical protein